jgi:hypothetical protein
MGVILPSRYGCCLAKFLRVGRISDSVRSQEMREVELEGTAFFGGVEKAIIGAGLGARFVGFGVSV